MLVVHTGSSFFHSLILRDEGSFTEKRGKKSLAAQGEKRTRPPVILALLTEKSSQ
jgi:hypothetical protein